MPVRQQYAKEKARTITDADRAFKAYDYVRIARGAAKSIGRKEKKAREREQEVIPTAKAPKEKKEKKVKGGAAAAADDE